MNALSIHPLANLAPEMTDEQYQALKADIQKHGQIEPILVVEGQILDGRHRYKACQELEIEPMVRQYTGDTSTVTLVALVSSLNQHRRHLTKDQLALMGAEILQQLEVEGQKRKMANLKGSAEVPKKALRENSGKSADQAASLVGGVSSSTVRRAKKVITESPDLAEPIRKGEMALTLAEKEAARRRNMAMGRPDSPALSPREKKLQWVIARIKLSSDKVLDEIEAKLRDSLR